MFDLNEILTATKGRLVPGRQRRKIKGVSVDSRTLKPGDVFIAIQGEHFDGHCFIRQAIARSASAVICQKAPRLKTDIPVILVKDTVAALGRLANRHRNKFDVPVVAITGSTGKTTTKELIADVLGRKYNVLKSVATQNNHIGVPLTLFRLNKKHQIVVLELGSNQKGDIRWLTRISEPTVSVLTNVGESHLERLKTPAGVFKEKFDIAKYARKGATVIFNKDDRYLRMVPLKYKTGRIVTFSIREKSDFYPMSLTYKNFNHIAFTLKEGGAFTLKTPVLHNVYNAIAAISCGRAFRISYNDIKAVIENFSSPPGRQAIQKIGPWWVIDDTYNANPISLRSAIDTLNYLNGPGRKILVCADMLELGEKSARLHRLVGDYAAHAKLDLILTFGKDARLISATARKNNPKVSAAHYRSLRQLNRKLFAYCRAGDVVLVKGSRRMKMERVIGFLEAKAKR